jgi:hypothetical protein
VHAEIFSPQVRLLIPVIEDTNSLMAQSGSHLLDVFSVLTGERQGYVVFAGSPID